MITLRFNPRKPCQTSETGARYHHPARWRDSCNAIGTRYSARVIRDVLPCPFSTCLPPPPAGGPLRGPLCPLPAGLSYQPFFCLLSRSCVLPALRTHRTVLRSHGFVLWIWGCRSPMG